MHYNISIFVRGKNQQSLGVQWTRYDRVLFLTADWLCSVSMTHRGAYRELADPYTLLVPVCNKGNNRNALHVHATLSQQNLTQIFSSLPQHHNKCGKRGVYFSSLTQV